MIAFATSSYGGPTVDTVEALLERLEPLGRGDVILVKGSRAAGLEAVADALVQTLAEPARR